MAARIRVAIRSACSALGILEDALIRTIIELEADWSNGFWALGQEYVEEVTIIQ
jgi:hypothetical protein